MRQLLLLHRGRNTSVSSGSVTQTPRWRRWILRHDPLRSDSNPSVSSVTLVPLKNRTGGLEDRGMGALQTLPGQPEYVDLAKKTGFSFEQIGVLHKRFKLLSHNEETLLREHFSQIPDLACNPIRSQITEAFFDRRNFRQNGAGTVEEIGFEEFLLVMSHFRPPTLHMTEEQRESLRRDKLRFLFNMHDTDNDGTITLEEYRHVVEELLSLSEGLEKNTAKSIADAAMLEVASISMGHMEPDEFYEGITFEHFLKLLHDFEIETRMNVRFLNMDATTLCK